MPYPDLSHPSVAQLDAGDIERQDREAAIVAAWDDGVTLESLSARHGLSIGTVRLILHAGDRSAIREPHKRQPSDSPEPACGIQGKGIEITVSSSMKRGSQDLLRAVLLLHMRTSTMPPGWTIDRFYQACNQLGICRASQA